MAKNTRVLAQSERLRAARTASGFKKAAEAIAKFRWKQSTYMAHENGQNGIGSIAAIEYGRAFKVDPGWILTGHGKGIEADASTGKTEDRTVAKTSADLIEIGGKEFVNVPIYDIRGSAGFGSENYDETPIDYFPVARSFLRAITDAPWQYIGILQIDGHSMYPTLHDRDLVFVDLRRKSLKKEGIYALNFEGETIIKRAQQHMETGHVTLTSDNSQYKSQVIKHPDRLHVIGHVFWSLTRH
jgi:phage repressor protein C with HTH and peptisase S24 domain